MNGIKLGEDMVEGKVVLNGTARTILEIKTKDGVVWPTVPVEYFVTLGSYSWNPTSATQSNTTSVISNCNWSAVASHSWLTVTKISNTSVGFTVGVNESLSQRVGTVMFQYNGVTLATFTVTQDAMEATYTLDNISVHYYPSGEYLKPDRSNYAYISADYTTWAGSTIISTERVICSPKYTISPSAKEAIVTENGYLYWDKDQYGTTEKRQGFVYASGEYAGLETSDLVRVEIGANTSTNTYEYTKTFEIPDLATHPIPWDGGSYQFNASSFATVTVNWTSGESQTLTPIAHTCQLWGNGDTTFSTYTVSGNTTGYVTFPDNPSSSGDYDREIRMTSDASGTKSFWYEQEARGVYTYVFEGVGSRSFEPSAAQTLVVAHFRSYRVQDNQPMPISYQVVESELTGLSVAYSWSGVDVYATIRFDANEDSSSRYAEINFIQDGTGEDAVGVIIEQQAAATWSITAELSYEGAWVKDDLLDLDGLIGFKSTDHVGNTRDVMKVTVSGLDSLSVYIRSDAETIWDYTIASNLDEATYPEYVSSGKASTSGQQSSGTDLSDYIKVDYTNLGGTEHHFFIVYRKDSSGSVGADEGYVLLPEGTVY